MSELRRVDAEPAFVLHSRSYRESSELLEAFTLHHGRIGLVAKGAKRNKSPFRGTLRLFQPLLISWSGRGDLEHWARLSVLQPLVTWAVLH